MLNRNLKRRIERIDGVSKVTLYGVNKKEVRIQLLADRIAAHKIDLNRLSTILRRSNFSVTAGKITDTNRRFVVRPIGEFKSVDDIGQIIINNNLRLKDVAKISYDHPRQLEMRHLDQKYAIGLEVFKESGANIVEVTNRILAEIEDIKNLTEMEGVSLFVMDSQADGILSSLNELLKSGLLGATLAVIILFFFLRRMTTTLIVTLAVPFSLLVTLSFMFFFNLTLNILSMMGLMLAIGMLVDNAVVVTESIHRHQLENDDKNYATLIGIKEVGMAITAGTLTTAIVFLPFLLSPNNQISIQINFVTITIIIALGASLLIAQTVVPLLASRVKPSERQKKETIVDKIIEWYADILGWTLSHRKITTSLIFLTLLSVTLPARYVKKDLFPPQGDRQLRLFYHINGHYTLEKVEEAVDMIEEYLFKNQEKFEIRSVYSYFTQGWASSTILLTKDDEVKRAQEIIREEIREGLPKLAIAKPTFDWRRPGGSRDNIRVNLIGKSSNLLEELSFEITWMLDQIPGLKDVRSDAEVGEKEVQVVVNRERARRYGYSTQQIANLVSVAMRGNNLRKLRDKEGEIDVRVEFRGDDRQTLDDLKNLPLFKENGETVILAAIADFTISRGPRGIHRENRSTSLGISANLDGITPGEAREQVTRLINRFKFPPGYSWSFGQNFDFEQETNKMLMTNTLLALILIYLVMAALFESLVFPAAIWSSISFAVVGVGWFFLITDTSFSMMAWIGVLLLIGVVVNNGIVLIDHINQLRAKGAKRDQAILQAGRERFRPILMTASTTVLSLLPLCFGTTQIGGGGPPYFPMARAIVSGLTFSTMVTLLILPTIYVLLDNLRNWSRNIIMLVKIGVLLS
jgi:HAE1 family hydrophobic/amphiphilic exporter-1